MSEPARADIADIVPEIRDLVPELEPSVRLEDAAQARFRMFESIRQFFASLCSRQPLLLVLDDLHWADAPSLRLLEFLAPELADSRLLLLGTYRPTELSRQHPLSDTLGELARAPHVVRIHLAGLNAEEVHDFIAAATGQGAARLARRIPAHSDRRQPAVPARDRAVPGTAGRVWRQSHHTADRTAADDPHPEGVREVIGRRLNLLSAACNDVLAVAAVIGRDFAHDVLLRAARPAE